MNLSQLLKDKKYLRRAPWPDITYIFLDGDIIMYSHLGIDTVYTPSHQDILGEDWQEVVPDR